MRYNQLTTEQFIEKAKKVHGNKYDYSKVNYVNNQTKVIIICLKHGEFKQTPGSHLSGCGCNECRKEKLSKSKTLSTEQFIEKARKIHGDKYDYSKVDYVSSCTQVCIICPNHGEFKQIPNNHLRGAGCPICYEERRGDTQRANTEEFIKKAKMVHGDKYDYSKVNYVNCSTEVSIICPKHGEFKQRPDHHLTSKCGCPYCQEKHLEECVAILLAENNVKYERQKTFEWLRYEKTGRPQFLDFYLPEHNIAIECQGEPHFQSVDAFGGESEFLKTVDRDENKYRKCTENGVLVLYFGRDKFKDKMVNKLYFTRKKDLLKKIMGD